MMYCESHHSRSNASLIIFSYLLSWSPGWGQLLELPRTLSSGCTSCWPSGRNCLSFLPASLGTFLILIRSYFCPISGCTRPVADASTEFSGGPTACDASDEFFRLIFTFSGADCFLSDFRTNASGSLDPNGFTPLNSFTARPSQNWRWLNTALIVLGVLRSVT